MAAPFGLFDGTAAKDAPGATLNAFGVGGLWHSFSRRQSHYAFFGCIGRDLLARFRADKASCEISL